MKTRNILLAGVLALAGAACGGSEEPARAAQTTAPREAAPRQVAVSANEIPTLRSELDRYPEYSIVLAGLRNEMTGEGPGGSTVPAYAHQYRLVWLDADKKPGARTTDWTPIPKDQYDREQRISGQAIVRKLANGQIDTIPTPPALAYVGNPQYGSWRDDGAGRNYWQPANQYLQYMLMAQIIDQLGDSRRRDGRVYRTDYDSYRSNPSAYRTRYSDTYRTAYTKTYGAKGAPATFNDRVKSGVRGTSTASFNDRVKSEVRGTGAIPATPATPASASASRGRATPATPATPARSASTAPAASSGGSYRPGRATTAQAPSTYTPPRPSAPKPSYRPSSSSRSSGSYRPSGSSSSSRGSSRRSSGRRRH